MIIFQQAAALEQHFGAANLHQQLDQRQLQMLQQHHIQQQQQMEHMMRRPEDSNIMQVIDLKSLEYTVLGTFISIICYVFLVFQFYMSRQL